MKSLRNMLESESKKQDTNNEYVINETIFNPEDGLTAIDKGVFVRFTFRL